METRKEYTMENNGASETVKVNISGLVGILFDRFVDMSSDQLPPEQKLYLNSNNELIFPSENIYSFMFGEKPGGCAVRFEGKQWKQYKMTGMSFITISPEFIPFTRNGKPITFGKFVNGVDEESGVRVLHHKANIAKGRLVIPSPKARPVLETPWELSFDVTIFKNHLIDVQKIKNWFVRGGIEVSLGTYRPRFGRFVVSFE